MFYIKLTNFPVRRITFLLGFLSIIFAGFLIGCTIPYTGKVVDKQTGQPIVDSVVVRSWDRIMATPAGAVTSFVGMKETLTDKNGKFSVFGLMHSPSIPILSRVEENNVVVFKPGYKLLKMNTKESVIKLERIPTFIQYRKEESDNASSNYEVDVYETNILRDLISKEEEFINSTKPYILKHITSEIPQQVKPLILSRSNGSGTGIATEIRGPSTSKNSVHVAANNPVSSKEDKIALNIKVLADQSLSANARSSAAASLGYSKDLRAVQPLIDALKDNSEMVKFQAVNSLGKQMDSKAVPYLINLLSDKESYSYMSVVVALGDIKDPRAIPYLLNLLQDEKMHIRYEAANALEKLHIDKINDPLIIDTIALLVRDLGDKNQNIQNRARYALVKFGEQAVEPLIKSLKSNNKAQKRESAYALGEIKDAKGIDPLIDLLNSNEEGVSWAAAGALSCYVDTKAEKALVNALKQKDGYFISTLSNILIRKDSRVIDYLLLLLKDNDETVRSKVAYILAFMKNEKVVDLLILLLIDHNPEVRKNAAIGLFLHPNEKAIKPLILTWNDNNAEVRTKVSEALVAIGSPANNQLILALKSTNPYVRWSAAMCLGRIGNPASVDALFTTLNDKVSEVRWTGINALEILKDERAVSKLLALCYDSDRGIRAKTESALTAITGSNDCLKVK